MSLCKNYFVSFIEQSLFNKLINKHILNTLWNTLNQMLNDPNTFQCNDNDYD